MRTIKFRAWYEPDEVLGLAGRMDYFDLHDRNWEATNGEHPVMQFTGLKDKKGKENYEGDIVECYGQRTITEWNDDRCGWSNGGMVAHGEIIGNIYENPELLTPITKKK